MKISALVSNYPVRSFNKTSSVNRVCTSNSSFNPRVISLSDYKKSLLNFTGENNRPVRDKEDIIFVSAESDPYSKDGGVGVVCKDYRSFGDARNQLEILPYYGADNPSDGSSPKPLTKTGSDGKEYYYMKTKKGEVKLRKVADKTIQWGLEKESPIMLFAIDDTEYENKEDKLTYIVFSEQVAKMIAPYKDGYNYVSGGQAKTAGWRGDPYPQFAKAVVEFLPDIIKDKGKDAKGNDFNPATIVCSDSQTAFIHEYLAKKVLNPDEDTSNAYYGIKPAQVAHNLGKGYCGETSAKNMFVNLGATPDDIELIENDPLYQNIKTDKEQEEYFAPLVQETIDEVGAASAIMVPLRYAEKGFCKSVTGVSEEYAKSISTNPQASPNIYKILAGKDDEDGKHIPGLYERGIFKGILNPLNDDTVDASKPLPFACATYNKSYDSQCNECTDKEKIAYPAFEVYPENPSYEDVRRIKNKNKLALLKRLNAPQTNIISGNVNASPNINPEINDKNVPIIKPEIIEKVEKLVEWDEKKANGTLKEGDDQTPPEEVPLFVSWGRSDTQKGHDITLEAFKQFAKTEEGKNAVLILGTGLRGDKESEIFKKKMTSILEDKDLQGRVIHIDGWAPGYALVSAGDAAIFSSRFEPCGLTDIEAMKYYCTPIVTATEGFKQKNFDPRIKEEEEYATSYKTTHEYNLLKSQVQPIIDAYVNDDKSKKEEIQKEFPTFTKKDEDGNETYDDTVFKDFAIAYKKQIKELKDKYKAEHGEDAKLPDNFDEWDELNKEHDFKYFGCARILKDGVLASEMKDTISAFCNESEDTKVKRFNNIKNIKTKWDDNNLLHGSKDSKNSHELYKEIHLAPDYTPPTEDMVLQIRDKDTIKEKVRKGQETDITERLKKYLPSALAGAVGILIGRGIKGTENLGAAREKELTDALSTANDALNAAKENIKKLTDDNKILEKTIKELQEKLASASSWKKLATYGAIGALVGGAVTFVGYKIYNKKVKKAVVTPEPHLVSTHTSGSSNPQLSFSLNKFMDKAAS